MPATRYIESSGGHFKHWHLDVSPSNIIRRQANRSDRGNTEEAIGRSASIPYDVVHGESSAGRKTLTIKFSSEKGVIYSFLLIKPDLTISPNSDPHLFTKSSGDEVMGTILENGKKFGYVFRPKYTSTNPQDKAQVTITLLEGLNEISSFDDLKNYKIRVNKFHTPVQSPPTNSNETLYTEMNFKKASSCNFEDIELGLFLYGTCGDGDDTITFRRVNKEVGGRKFSYLIEKGLKINEDFFLSENQNIIRTSHASEDYLNDYARMVRICGSATSITGKSVYIWNSAQLSNVIVKGSKHGFIDIAGQAIVHNADISSSEGNVEIDGGSRVKGNAEKFLKLRGGRKLGLLIRWATVDTSLSSKSSKISGNLYINFGRIRGTPNINVDSTPLLFHSYIGGQVQGVTTITGILTTSSDTVVRNSIIHGDTPIRINDDRSYLLYIAGRGVVYNSELDGVFELTGRVSNGGKVVLGSTCHYYSKVEGNVSGFTLEKTTPGMFNTQNMFVPAPTSSEECNRKFTRNDSLDESLFLENDERYRDAMKSLNEGVLRRKIFSRQEEARRLKKKRAKEKAFENHLP